MEALHASSMCVFMYVIDNQKNKKGVVTQIVSQSMGIGIKQALLDSSRWHQAYPTGMGIQDGEE